MSIPHEVISQGQEVVTHSSMALPFAGSALATGGGLFSVFKCIQVIPQGYVGIRTRFGNPSKVPQTGEPGNDELVEQNLRQVLRPGKLPVAHVPFSHSIQKVSTQDRATEIATKVQNDWDGKTREVSGTVYWGVQPDAVSVYRALYKPQGDEKGKPCDPNLVKMAEGELLSSFRTIMEAFPVKEKDDEKEKWRNYENMENAMYWLTMDGMSKYGCRVRALKLGEQAMALGQFLIEANSHDGPDTKGPAALNGSTSRAVVLAESDEVPLRIAAR